MTPDGQDPNDAAAAHLAERFAADAQALRRRADQLDAARSGAGSPGGARGGRAAAAPVGGPSPAACRQMADACDRVSALCAGARDGVALGALIPLLERALADERSADARHVYAGALTRLRQAVGDEAFDDDDDESDEGDEGDDHEDADDDD